jgi:hypothetical protein
VADQLMVCGATSGVPTSRLLAPSGPGAARRAAALLAVIAALPAAVPPVLAAVAGQKG